MGFSELLPAVLPGLEQCPPATKPPIARAQGQVGVRGLSQGTNNRAQVPQGATTKHKFPCPTQVTIPYASATHYPQRHNPALSLPHHTHATFFKWELTQGSSAVVASPGQQGHARLPAQPLMPIFHLCLGVPHCHSQDTLPASAPPTLEDMHPNQGSCFILPLGCAM
jgi:hypothetical protein